MKEFFAGNVPTRKAGSDRRMRSAGALGCKPAHIVRRNASSKLVNSKISFLDEIHLNLRLPIHLTVLDKQVFD